MSSTFCGVAAEGPASFSRWAMRKTWVSTAMPWGSLKASHMTQLAVLRPTPGSFCSSSTSAGTSPPKSAVTICASATRFFALLRKNPSEWMISATSSDEAAAMAAGVGKAANRRGVTLFTAASVHWADSTTATVSSKGVR